MTNAFAESDHPRVTDGRFTDKAQSAPETSLAVPAGFAWTPHPDVASVEKNPTDDFDYLITLRDDPILGLGLASVSLRQEPLSQEELFDNITFTRTEHTISATAEINGVDFTEVNDDPEWLIAHQQQINEYLLTTYGATDDDTTDWDCSNLHVSADVTDLATASGDELTVSATAAHDHLWNRNEKVRALNNDLEDNAFVSKLRDHLTARQ